MTQTIATIALIIFSLLMVTIGIKSYGKTKNMQDFLLGGRKIGAWMSAFAYGTSYFSAVIFIGYAGKTGWNIGLGGIWVGIGNALLGSALAWLLLAKRTHRMTRTLEANTMPEFFAKRYKDPKMKIYSALIIFIFLLPYAASVYMGLGYLFNSIFPGVPVETCMIIIAVLSAFYLVLGGYVATAITDFIQGVIMLAGIVVMVICIVTNPQVGGIAAGLEKLKGIDVNLTNIFGGVNWLTLLSTVLLTSFGTWGLPQMVHKFYAIKDDAAIKKGTIIATVFAAIIGCGAYFSGIFGRLFLNNTLPVEGYDKVVPDMLIAALGNDVFGNVVLSVILLLILSASMSTLSSVVLASSSAISVDLLEQVKPDVDKKKQMLFMRTLCCVFVILSCACAIGKISFIIALMSFSWGTVSGCFIGPYVWGLYSKKVTKAGAWSGMIAGLVTVLSLVIVTTAVSGFSAATANSPLYGVIAMVVSIIIVPLVSMFTRKLNCADVDAAFSNIK
ncbi:MAG: sodium:solute symporter [Clostridia bacterium]|nr:sodium:solute symporter [Clostridia bacterium]